MNTRTAANQTRKTAAETAGTIGVETRKSVEEGGETLRKGIASATAFNQANLEAVVTSSQIGARALETIASEIAAYSKKSYEDGMAAAKALSSCRNAAELVEKQAELQRRSIESFVAEAARLNELYARAASDAFAPIGERFAAAVDMVRGHRS